MNVVLYCTYNEHVRYSTSRGFKCPLAVPKIRKGSCPNDYLKAEALYPKSTLLMTPLPKVFIENLYSSLLLKEFKINTTNQQPNKKISPHPQFSPCRYNLLYFSPYYHSTVCSLSPLPYPTWGLQGVVSFANTKTYLPCQGLPGVRRARQFYLLINPLLSFPPIWRWANGMV